MKTILRHLTLKRLIIPLLLIVEASSAHSATGVAKAGVNFRSRPDNGPVVGTVAAGTSFEVIGKDGAWTKVRLSNGREGYIFSQYVGMDQTSVPDTPQFATGVATTGVNFRASPNGNIITGVGKGTFFDILRSEGPWTRVRLANGQEGYIYSQYIGKDHPDVPDTEGAYCPSCAAAAAVVTTQISQAEDITEVVNAAGAGGQCVTRKLMEGAHWVHKNKYGGRTKGKGKCGLAVRQSLNRAGIWQGGGIGNAKDMIPGLKNMGFKNIMTSDMTPATAPAGTILVYGKKLPNARGCTGLGSTFGHIEIKESNDSFLYDGNPSWHIQEAYPARCRPLIGVMQMGGSCPTCSDAVKRACGV